MKMPMKEIPPEAVLINRMIMKDNDAGLISGNSAKSYHLLDKVSHVDPKTYNRFFDLQKELQNRRSLSGIKPSFSLRRLTLTL